MLMYEGGIFGAVGCFDGSFFLTGTFFAAAPFLLGLFFTRGMIDSIDIGRSIVKLKLTVVPLTGADAVFYFENQANGASDNFVRSWGRGYVNLACDASFPNFSHV